VDIAKKSFWATEDTTLYVFAWQVPLTLQREPPWSPPTLVIFLSMFSQVALFQLDKSTAIPSEDSEEPDYPADQVGSYPSVVVG
jgi:hypothetical protein